MSNVCLCIVPSIEMNALPKVDKYCWGRTMTILCSVVRTLPNSNVLSLSGVRYLSGRRPDPQTSETGLRAGSNPPCCHFETRACCFPPLQPVQSAL